LGAVGAACEVTWGSVRVFDAVLRSASSFVMSVISLLLARVTCCISGQGWQRDGQEHCGGCPELKRRVHRARAAAGVNVRAGLQSC
jgi:hypothetical protein